MYNNLLKLILIFSLSSCGFRPVYKADSYDNSCLSLIEIEPISSIAGAELYHKLSTMIPASKNTKYLLKIIATNSEIPLAMQKNSDVIRQIIYQTLQYQLIDKETGKIVKIEKINRTSSYNTVLSAYATNVESEKTLENLTRFVAEEIRTRLILYFNNTNCKSAIGMK